MKSTKNEEVIREWKTQTLKAKIAYVLMLDGISFHYNQEDGIAFGVPDFYIKSLIEQLATCYSSNQEQILIGKY